MMSKDLQELLQECLDGYEAGLTPEECLSAYPQARQELEPLLRQALSLRMAYAASPRTEFRLQAREKLMFAAGRDVSRALAAEPDPEFIDATRRRLLNTAGASAQEALRDVPPPRLPFWANARRHLLEAASKAPPKPEPRVPVLMRTTLSAAVIVLAVAIAGAGFFMHNSPANDTVSAELNAISEDIRTAEQLTASGQLVSSSFLDDLAERTSKLAEVYASVLDPELKESLPDLIDRQRSLADSRQLDETLALAQERLDEADEKVAAAAVAEAPAPTETAVTTAITEVTPEATAQPTEQPTEVPESTELPDISPVEPEDLTERQIAIHYDLAEDTLDLRWLKVTTSTLAFRMPDTWSIINLEDDRGLTVFASDFLFIETDIADIRLVVSVLGGEVDAVINDQQYTLRSEGSGGGLIDTAELAALAGEAAPALFAMLRSVEVIEPAPEATSTPTPTATDEPAPEATATPEPTATPSTPSRPEVTP